MLWHVILPSLPCMSITDVRVGWLVIYLCWTACYCIVKYHISGNHRRGCLCPVCCHIITVLRSLLLSHIRHTVSKWISWSYCFLYWTTLSLTCFFLLTRLCLWSMHTMRGTYKSRYWCINIDAVLVWLWVTSAYKSCFVCCVVRSRQRCAVSADALQRHRLQTAVEQFPGFCW